METMSQNDLAGLLGAFELDSHKFKTTGQKTAAQRARASLLQIQKICAAQRKSILAESKVKMNERKASKSAKAIKSAETVEASDVPTKQPEPAAEPVAPVSSQAACDVSEEIAAEIPQKQPRKKATKPKPVVIKKRVVRRDS